MQITVYTVGDRMVLEFFYNKKIKRLINSRVDSKEKIWKIILETSKLILTGNLVSKKNAEGKLIIDTEFRRIFFSQKLPSAENKHFSFQFPFKIEQNANNYTLKTFSQATDIQSAHIQVILSLLDKGILSESRGVYGIQLEFCELVENTLEELFLSKKLVEDLDDILLELFLFEPSYIRFDEDKKNANGKIHPLFHFDIFYSQQTTLKLGLSKLYDLDYFVKFLCEKEKECSFISE